MAVSVRSWWLMLPHISRQQALVIVMVLTAIALIINASYIHIKAGMGQYLIRVAWQQSIATGEPSKPWDWADTWPVAQLQIPALGVDQIVLSGDSGQSLAFGPGHSYDSAVPGEQGVAVISGHRDTHFHFLSQLQPGHAIVISRNDGGVVRYRVSGAEVFDTRVAGLRLLPSDSIDLEAGQPIRSLLLVTCWPFDGVQANTPWRYLVTAEEVTSAVSGLDKGVEREVL